MSDTTTNWKIYVSGYGTFDFEGTEAEAEEARIAKGQWERGTSLKYRADLSRESDRLTAEMVDLFSEGRGVPIALGRRRRAALQAEVIAKAEGRTP